MENKGKYNFYGRLEHTKAYQNKITYCQSLCVTIYNWDRHPDVTRV